MSKQRYTAGWGEHDQQEFDTFEEAKSWLAASCEEEADFMDDRGRYEAAKNMRRETIVIRKWTEARNLKTTVGGETHFIRGV